jgi:CRP-like cAMP-binding protein
MSDPLEALRHSRLAAELSDGECRLLSERVVLRDLRDGEVLVREGRSDNHLYVIVRGALSAIKNVGQAEAVALFTIGAGDFVDELGFIDGSEHYASLVAVGDTRVLGLERETLESLLTSHPQIVYKVMRAIVRTVHQIQRRLSMQSVELTNYIYKQHGKY